MTDELRLDQLASPQPEGALLIATASASRGGLFGLAAGALCLTACIGASLLLALAELETVELPGCGSVSDCSRAAASRWGKLPGTDWPLSFVGFAYFQAVAATLLYGRGRLPGLLRATLVLGGGVSLLLVGVMVVEGYLCGYCLTVHAANVAFVAWSEIRHRRGRAEQPARRPWSTVASFTATFVLTSLLLALIDRQSTAAANEAARAELEQALSQATQIDPSDNDRRPFFAPGRYVLGPESAKVQITVVSDYQCASCRQMDAQIRMMTAGRHDVAISMRHFPFCTDCNDHIDKTRHENACRAAVAAEAAGIAGGPDAFWQMHDWLFEHEGRFTDEELIEFVREADIDKSAFRAALTSDEVMETIRADTQAADAAGLKFTPMIFINGQPIDVAR